MRNSTIYEFFYVYTTHIMLYVEIWDKQNDAICKQCANELQNIQLSMMCEAKEKKDIRYLKDIVSGFQRRKILLFLEDFQFLIQGNLLIVSIVFLLWESNDSNTIFFFIKEVSSRGSWFVPSCWHGKGCLICCTFVTFPSQKKEK